MSPRADDRAALHIPSLDGIRAVAFALVFAAHAGLDKVVPGGLGVTIFFFLSGYLITTLLRMEHDASGTISFRQFYLRRAFRILPPFYLVLTLAVVGASVGVLAGGFEPRAVAAQIFHLANYWSVRHGGEGQPAGTGVYWSLAVEEHFYLMFACAYLLLRRHVSGSRSQAIVLWLICATVLVWRCVLVYGMGAPTDRTYLASDTRIDSILFGCALAVWGNPVLDGPSRISDPIWKCVLVPGGVALLLVSLLFRDAHFRETFRYSLQGVALYPLFIAAMRFPRWGLVRLLNLPAVAFVGVLSYSLYLVHHVVLSALDGTFAQHAVVRAVIALGLSTAIAWAIHLGVEKPCARLRKRAAAMIGTRASAEMSAHAQTGSHCRSGGSRFRQSGRQQPAGLP